MILLAVIKAHKLVATAWVGGMALIAAAEATSNRTLIGIAILSNVTLLIVSILNRKVVAQLPAAIQKLEISLDGKLEKYVASEKAVSHAAGMEQERGEERARTDAAGAAVNQARVNEASAHPAEVIVANPKSDPANVRQAE